MLFVLVCLMRPKFPVGVRKYTTVPMEGDPLTIRRIFSTRRSKTMWDTFVKVICALGVQDTWYRSMPVPTMLIGVLQLLICVNPAGVPPVQ
jgi:hypothetical protein